MWILPLLCLVSWLLFITSLFTSGFNLINHREYVVGGGFWGPRDSANQRVKYRLIGDSAVRMGKIFVIGGALLGAAFLCPIPLWLITKSADCVGTFAGLTCMAGWGVLILGNLITWYAGDWRKIEDDDQE